MLPCRALLPLAVLQPGVLQHAMPAATEPASLAGLLSWLYSKAWAACSDGIKRRTGLTAAFVATCLHPVLFDVQQADDSRWVEGSRPHAARVCIQRHCTQLTWHFA